MEDDTKKRIPVWLYPKTLKRMDECLDLGNCKSRSEYIENAVSFYNGYLLSKESSPYLPVILTSAMSGIVEASETVSYTHLDVYKRQVLEAAVNDSVRLAMQEDAQQDGMTGMDSLR